ncbi:MAG: hypothetical protein U1E65_15065 [Myxococcota bacterium]
MRDTSDAEFEAAFERYLATLLPAIPDEDEDERPTWFQRAPDGSLRPLQRAWDVEPGI